MESSQRTLPEGFKISTYTVRRKLGSGGMGDVYLCDDQALGRQVAVKVMHAMESDDPVAVSRFIQEGKALAKLTHPNIVSIFGLGEENGLLYIAMEHVHGQSLFQHSRNRKLSITEMVNVFCDIAYGLDHAHSAGIVHRDIKPANILVDSFGRGKIIDFGIAKAVGGNAIGPEGVKTKTGVVIGTLNYIAPELFRGDPPSPLSDIYALGLCFFEMLTGRTPFKGETQFSTMEKIRSGDLELPENLRLLLPEEFWKILYQMIAAEPTERIATASAAANRLKAIKLSELPKAWSVPLATVKFDNLVALQSRLEEVGIDQAEWQFVLSSALKRQSDRPRTAPIAIEAGGSTVGSYEDNGESTSLIETTGILLKIDTLEDAIQEYRSDLEKLLTSFRSTRLDELTPPPVFDEKNSASTSNFQTVTSAPQSVREAPQTANHPMNVEEASSGYLKWVALAVVAAISFVGFSQYRRWEKDQATKLALIEAQKALAEKAAKLNAQRGQKVLAPVAKGFAMVVEPSSDPWPPIPWQREVIGSERDWLWTLKSPNGEISKLAETRTLIAEEDGLLKFQVKSAASQSVSGEAFEWYQPGFLAIPRRATGSTVFGGLGGTVIGQPELIFPLRKGKEVHFEFTLNQEDNKGFPTFLKFGASLKARGSCVVGDKANVQSDGHGFVKTTCTFKTDASLEVSLAITWDEGHRKFVKQEYRLINTANDRYDVTTLVGTESLSGSNVRNPTSN